MDDGQVTALLTDEEIRGAAEEGYESQHDMDCFTTGARFARDHYEAAMQRERECREKLVEALYETTDAIICHDERPPGTYTACGMEFPILFDKINAALAAAKELE